MDANRRKTLYGSLTAIYLFAAFGLVVFIMMWNSALSPQRAAKIAAPYGINIPQHWKAVVLNYAEDSDEVVEAYNWPLGTVRENPIGFKVAIALVIAFIAVPLTIMAIIWWTSTPPEPIYWDHRTGTYVDPADDPATKRQLPVKPHAPNPDV